MQTNFLFIEGLPLDFLNPRSIILFICILQGAIFAALLLLRYFKRGKSADEINRALDALKNTAPEILFEERFVGREKLPTNVFGLLFHIAEHTARHVGQIITTVKFVRKE